MDGDLQARADMAFAVQNELEEKLLEELRYWAARTGCSNIVLSGGTALNCRLAGRIMTEEAQWQLHVPFAPGDTGQSLGNAIYGLIHLGEPIPPALKSPFLGPAHPQEERGFQKLSRGFRVRKTDIPKNRRPASYEGGRPGSALRSVGIRAAGPGAPLYPGRAQ